MRFENDKHNTSFYKQLRGTAIGIKMAPPYVIIFMGDLEEKLLKVCDKKSLAWWRHIDDIFMLWQHGEKELLKIFELLPSHNKTYRQLFTRRDQFSVRKKDKQLVADLYINQQTHINIYMLALRWNRICSEKLSYDKRCNKLEIWLTVVRDMVNCG